LANRKPNPSTTAKRLDLNNDLHAEIKANIIKGIMSVFNRAPEVNKFSDLFKTKEKAIKNFPKIFQTLYFNKFQTDDEHIKLLKIINYKKLKDKEQLDFFFLMFNVYEKKREYTLAMPFVEQGIELSTKLKQYDTKLSFMIGKGLLLIKLDHPEVVKHHQEIIKFAKDKKIEKGLHWAYQNWGTYNLDKNNISEALLLYEKTIPLLEKEGKSKLAYQYGYLGTIYESIDIRESISKYEKVISLLESEKENNFNKISISEACYRIGRLKLILNDNYNEILNLVLKSKDLLEQIDGYEARLAWNYGLIAICYEKLKKPKLAKEYEGKKQRLLKYFGSDKELFRNTLAKYINENNPKNTEEIKSLEGIAINSKDRELLLIWALVYTSHLMNNKKFKECISLCNYVIRIIESEKKLLQKSEVKESLSTIHDINFISLAGIKKYDESLKELEKAVQYNPVNYNLRWKLAQNYFNFKNFEKAMEHSKYLIEKGFTGPGPYRIISYGEFAKNNIDKSISILMEARKLFPDHDEIKAELEELGDINRGTLDLAESKFFKDFTERMDVNIEEVSEKEPSLPEFLTLSNFHRDLIGKVPNFIYQIQKTVPPFIRIAKENGFKNIEEGDFRDELERMLSFNYKNIAAEVKHASGLADLIVHAADNYLDAIIFEFKIWNRNDYKSVVSQVLKYLTDFQFCAVIFMVNLNKGGIDNKYIEEIILQDKSYILGTFREKPIDFAAINFSHYYSEHTINNDKRYKIFHFIYNPN
jgi:tetratricopeptide (TPR) repeat protein